MTIKDLRQKLCTHCTEHLRKIRTFPVRIDDEGHIIYRRWARKCHLKPITQDVKECPYFKEMPGSGIGT